MSFPFHVPYNHDHQKMSTKNLGPKISTSSVYGSSQRDYIFLLSPTPRGHPITKQGGNWSRYDCHTPHGWL